MITFSKSPSLPMGVYDNGQHVGNIRVHEVNGRTCGFFYQSKSGGSPGRTFQTVQDVKKSIADKCSDEFGHHMNLNGECLKCGHFDRTRKGERPLSY